MGGGDVAKNQRKNADLPSTLSARNKYVTILYKLLDPHPRCNSFCYLTNRVNEEEDSEEELSETEEAWESAKGGAGGEENVAKNQRKNTDLPSN